MKEGSLSRDEVQDRTLADITISSTRALDVIKPTTTGAVDCSALSIKANPHQRVVYELVFLVRVDAQSSLFRGSSFSALVQSVIITRAAGMLLTGLIW